MAAWTIGPFRVLERIGKGGMGEVYLARDTRLGRKIALKLLPAAAASDTESIARFELEARAVARLAHPNVCVLHDIGVTEDGRRYIAMEYVEGETLRARLARGRMAIDRVVDVVSQIGEALRAAHAVRIVHRDIKPENVMLRPDGYAKVLDFGLAKLGEHHDVDADSPTDEVDVQTQPGLVMGTVAYMSPEQARGQVLDARTDLWSLGVILYESVAGRHPFAGETSSDMMANILNTEPVPLSALAPEAPEALARIVVRALSKSRSGRYQTADELTRDLDRVEDDLLIARRRSDAADPGVSEITRILPGSPENAPLEATIVVRSALAPKQTNLPTLLAPLVGRERELTEIVAELRREEVRLVTLTGPGGTGKTRLALEVATSMVDEFGGEVAMVDLASVTDAGLVLPAILRALNVPDAGATVSSVEVLDRALGDRRMLLVVDNVEQVIDAAPQLAALVIAAPALKLLVTSRERLRVKAERQFEVLPLALPPVEHLPTPDALVRCGAIALFLDRARAADPSFAISTENARAIAEICVRLEGIPLAIELAAARLKQLSPDGLNARLADRLKVLTGGARDLPARQKTMRDTVAWSYELLDDRERRLFARLSVFAGGWSLEAAETVCAGEEIEAEDVLDLLANLVEKSMVIVDRQSSAVRYRMLEILRQYGSERLRETGDEARLLARHRDWFLEFAERLHRQASDGASHAQTRRVLLETEHENIRAVLQRRVEGVDDAEANLRLCVAVGDFWERQGYWSEGLVRTEAAIEASAQAPTLLRAHALRRAGYLAMKREDFDRAKTYFDRALELGRATDDGPFVASVYQGLGRASMSAGDAVRAETFWEQSLQFFQASGDEDAAMGVLSDLGRIRMDRGEYDRAIQSFEQNLRRCRSAGMAEGEAIELCNLAEVAQRREQWDHAVTLLHQARDIAREHGYRSISANVALDLGAILVERQDPDRATPLLEEALILVRELGSRSKTVDVLETLSRAAEAQGDARRAVVLLGAAAVGAAAVGEVVSLDVDSLEPHGQRACEALGHDESERAFAEGSRMTVQQAVEYALRNRPDAQ